MGSTRLDVQVRGPAYRDVRALIDERLAAFVDRRSGATPKREIRCQFTFVGTSWLPHDPGHPSEPVAQRLSDDAWWAEWSYYRGAFTSTRADAILVSRHPALEHALRAAAVFPSMPDELYVHGASLVYAGRAWVFVGHPNAGKSTIAVEGGADSVVSNEISILGQRPDGTWVVRPSPFWGTGDRAHWHPTTPLAGVVVLTQAAERNAWRVLEGARAVQGLMPHLGCQARAQLAEPPMLERVAELAGAIPIASLAWHRPSHPFDGGPWKP